MDRHCVNESKNRNVETGPIEYSFKINPGAEQFLRGEMYNVIMGSSSWSISAI
jgi:hypothetical protein